MNSPKERVWNNYYFLWGVIRQKSFSLDKVPKQYHSKLLWRLAVQQSGHELKYVPEEHRSKDLCQLAVRKNGGALKYVPKESRDEELCQLAVQQDGYARWYVPEEHHGEEWYRLVEQQDYTPEESLCQLAGQKNGEVSVPIPEHLFQDRYFCLQLVKDSGLGINRVLDTLIDEAFIEAIIEHYRANYMEQGTHNIFTHAYRQPSFFSQWSKVKPESQVNTLVEICFTQASDDTSYSNAGGLSQ